jgi:hypothetical protein
MKTTIMTIAEKKDAEGNEKEKRHEAKAAATKEKSQRGSIDEKETIPHHHQIQMIQVALHLLLGNVTVVGSVVTRESMKGIENDIIEMMTVIERNK